MRGHPSEPDLIAPAESISIDYANYNNQDILVIKDRSSGFIAAVLCNNQSTEDSVMVGPNEQYALSMVPEEGEHQEGQTGTPTGVDIQSKQPHPEWKNRQEETMARRRCDRRAKDLRRLNLSLLHCGPQQRRPLSEDLTLPEASQSCYLHQQGCWSNTRPSLYEHKVKG